MNTNFTPNPQAQAFIPRNPSYSGYAPPQQGTLLYEHGFGRTSSTPHLPHMGNGVHSHIDTERSYAQVSQAYSHNSQMSNGATGGLSFSAAMQQHAAGTMQARSSPVAATTGMNGHGYGEQPSYYSQAHHPDAYGVSVPQNMQHIPELTYVQYTGAPPHISQLQSQDFLPGFFPEKSNVNNYTIKNDLLRRQRFLHFGLFGSADLPMCLNERYVGLCPLEQHNGMRSSTFNVVVSIYKAMDKHDNQVYCLYRIHNYPSSEITETLQKWKNIWKRMKHPNLVQFRNVFQTKQFGDVSLVLVYDYQPLAETLPRHLSWLQKNASRKYGTSVMKEPCLWSFIIQIASALHYVHTNNLSFRTLSMSKVLVFNKSRLRLNCPGLLDMLEGTDPYRNVNNAFHSDAERAADMQLFGRLVLGMAYGQPVTMDSEQEAFDTLQKAYSADLTSFVTDLCHGRLKVDALATRIGHKFFSQFDSLQRQSDYLEDELAREMQNGRLFRLSCKLCMIVNRPNLGKDANWAETGDRYQLRLFRDYLYHQVTGSGAPWLDLAHCVQALNKLDSGSSEMVSLISPDEKVVLIMSYYDLKQCLRRAWTDLIQSSEYQGTS